MKANGIVDMKNMKAIEGMIISGEQRGEWETWEYLRAVNMLDAEAVEAYYFQGTTDGREAVTTIEALTARANAITLSDVDTMDLPAEEEEETLEDAANGLTYRVERVVEALDYRDPSVSDVRALVKADEMIDIYNDPSANAALTDMERDALDDLADALVSYSMARYGATD